MMPAVTEKPERAFTMPRQVQVRMEIDGRNYVGTTTLTPESLFTPGQAISLIGRTYRGLGTVAKEHEDGSVSVRVFDENSRTRKRVRVFANEVAGMLSSVTPATSGDFRAGDAVTLNGVRFVGRGTVEKVDGADVIIRHADTGKRLRVFGVDLSQGRLARA